MNASVRPALRPEALCHPLMTPSNNTAVATAQEWIAVLDAWVDTHSLEGFDPFDVKQHPWIRAAQPHPFFRKATTGLCDLFPNLSRRLLGIQPTHNAKAYALVALAKLRMAQLTGEARHLDHALRCLQWLLENSAPSATGLAWGYPFDIHAKGLDTPAGTPIGVVSAIAGQSFCLAHEVTGAPEYLEHARAIGEFMLHDLPRMDGGHDTYCFAYTPTDRRRVHNANLLVAEHLFRLGALTGEPHYTDIATPALRFTLRAQREDGAWPYGEVDLTAPYEAGLLQLVDHHHTGFVLRSLHAIRHATGDDTLDAVIRKGFAFYKQHLFHPPWGMPINEYGAYPVDIHACAEAILCPSVLARDVLAARGFADLPLRWTHYFLRDRKTGLPWYRKYPRFTSRISFPRWGTAWVYYAMAEYLYVAYRPKN